MPASQLLDLYIDDQGEIAPGSNGDILIERDSDVVAKEILWRIKTTRGDWVLQPQCGADLELLIGEPNSPETGAVAEAQVSRALTHDGFLLGELRDVRAVPVNRDQIAILISVEYGEDAFTLPVTLDLKEGVF
jgi:hypothetical protein